MHDCDLFSRHEWFIISCIIDEFLKLLSYPMRCSDVFCCLSFANGKVILFVTRSTRVWNVLPKKLTEKNTTFSSFKNGLYEYYKFALINYDAEDPRTWKSICLSCNMCRNLSCPILCCC